MNTAVNATDFVYKDRIDESQMELKELKMYLKELTCEAPK